MKHAITPDELATAGAAVGETLACVLADSIQLFFPRDVTHIVLAPQWFPNQPYLLNLFNGTAYESHALPINAIQLQINMCLKNNNKQSIKNNLHHE